MDTIVRNVLLGISLAAPLGPSGVTVIHTGLRRGFLPAFVTGVGVTLADATYLLIVYFGLSGFMSRPLVNIVVLGMGTLVLIYLGIQSMREAGKGFDIDTQSPASTRNPLLVGYLVNVSNPIAVVWWVGVFGGLLGLTPGGGQSIRALGLSATILIGILAWHTSTSALSHWGRGFLSSGFTKGVSIVAGISLIQFGLRFGYQAIRVLTG